MRITLQATPGGGGTTGQGTLSIALTYGSRRRSRVNGHRWVLVLGTPGLEPGNMGTLQLLVKQFFMSLLLHDPIESLKQGDFSVLDENLLVGNDLPELTQQDRGGGKVQTQPWKPMVHNQP